MSNIQWPSRNPYFGLQTARVAAPPPELTIRRTAIDTQALPEARLLPPMRIPAPTPRVTNYNPLFNALQGAIATPNFMPMQTHWQTISIPQPLAKPKPKAPIPIKTIRVLEQPREERKKPTHVSVSSSVSSSSESEDEIEDSDNDMPALVTPKKSSSSGKNKKHGRHGQRSHRSDALPEDDIVVPPSAPLPRRKPSPDAATELALKTDFETTSLGDPVALQELLDMDKHDRALLVRLTWQHPGIGRAFSYYFDLRPVGLREGIKFFEYQKTALLWMHDREAAPPVEGIIGGVFNPDMGLGKTIMFLMHVFWRTKPKGAFPALAIASNAVMLEWKAQLEKFFEPEFVKQRVLFMHKSLNPNVDSTSRADLAGKDLVITTYDALLIAYRKLPQSTIETCLEYVSAEKQNQIATIHCRTLGTASEPTWRGDQLLYGTPWDVVVRDESQRIANPKSKTFFSNMLLYGRCKWLMTGTIVRNYLKDIYSQLRAIGYTGVTRTRDWTLTRARDCYVKHKLANVIYRLSYEDALVELPPMHDHILYVELSTTERAIYTIIEKQAQSIYDRVLSKMAQYNDIRVMILRLRQVCIAPWLLNARGALDEVDAEEENESDGGDTEKETKPRSRKRPAKRAPESAPEPAAKRQRTESEKPRYRDNKSSSDMDASSSSNVGALRACRDSDESISLGSSDSDSDSDSGEDDTDEKDIKGEQDDTGIMATPLESVPDGEGSLFDYCRKMDSAGGIGASKVVAALAKIAEFFLANPKRKLIIFSMFSSVLALVARAIDIKQAREVATDATGEAAKLWPEALRTFSVLTIDGSTIGAERADLIFAFRNSASTRIALIQGKIGGEGLNLQEASDDMEVTGMIIMEPHWTRQAKRQQKRRIHRIGQKHETYCWEMVVKDSIEDKVLELCDAKDKIELNFMHRQRGRPSAATAGAMSLGNIGHMLGRRGNHNKFG